MKPLFSVKAERPVLTQDFNKERVCHVCKKKYKEGDDFGRWRCNFHIGGFDNGKWSCCGATVKNAVGCVDADHMDWGSRLDWGYLYQSDVDVIALYRPKPPHGFHPKAFIDGSLKSILVSSYGGEKKISRKYYFFKRDSRLTDTVYFAKISNFLQDEICKSKGVLIEDGKPV